MMKNKHYYKDDSVLDCWDGNRIPHRDDGPAIEYANGSEEWYIDGMFHREDGPAVKWINGRKEWWVNGKLHREDGPAIEFADGKKGWYINGKHLTKEEFDIHPVRVNYLFTKALEKELTCKNETNTLCK